MQRIRTRVEQVSNAISIRRFWANVCIATSILYLVSLSFTFICHFWPESFECGVISHELKSLIFNGSEAPLGAVPWYVALKTKSSKNPKCGGTIISKKWVITAKHCAINCRNFSCIIVIAGAQHIFDHTNGSVHKVLDYVPFGDPDDEEIDDIALLNVSPSFKWQTSDLYGNRRGIAPVCLPEFREKVTEKEAVASGFGRINEFHSIRPEYLTTVTQKMYTWEFCMNTMKYGEAGPKICAGNIEERKSACGGDSGGPLTVMRRNKVTLVGVTHAGDLKGCEKGAFYMDVAEYRNWIKYQTGI